ncbi:MAG: hypothetical protein RLZZ230_568 [Candidatus Parcubacteria bacterium]|jgi:dUTP pyrophosphatase
MEILIKRLNDNAKLPVYSREAGPGIDLYASEEVTIEPSKRAIIATGVAMAMPVGYVGMIWNQQGVTTGEAIKVTTGVIDSGYREEIKVELKNIGTETKTFLVGDKLAQLLIQQIHHANLIEAEEFGGDE